MRLAGLVRALGGRAEQTGMFVAAANVPGSLQPTLMPRSTLDQALITGTSMALGYAITEIVHDPLEVLARRVARYGPPDTADSRRRRTTASVDVCGMVAGFALQTAFRRRPGERLGRGSVRTLGYFLSLAGFSGAAVAGLEEALAALDERLGLRSLPLALPLGAAFSVISDSLRKPPAGGATGGGRQVPERPSAWRSVALGSAVGTGLAAIAGAERALAAAFAEAFDRVWPGDARAGSIAGHAVALASLVGGVAAALQRQFHRMETIAARFESGYDTPPRSAMVSGSPKSLVPFATLGAQGRRYVVTALSRSCIEEIMEEPSAAEPIRIFVGLDSAPTERGRAELALAELDRTGGLDRSLLMLVSPTGTGHANHAAVEAVEYLTRGDCASVTLQYSKRPSSFSLGAVDEGRRQNRMLFEAIHERLRSRPAAARPRVVLFGESLGAHTSQDAFIHRGTQGLIDLGIERALWIGTPYASAWKQQVLHDDGPHIDASLVARVAGLAELEALPELGTRTRYVMLTHHDDAVAYFGIDLLLACPDWLGDPATRPPGVPHSARYSPINTFLQTLVDMKNAAHVARGSFAARGHDYRAELSATVRLVYGLDATPRQRDRIESSVRARELERAQMAAGPHRRQE